MQDENYEPTGSGARAVIAEYKNTKVGELTPKKSLSSSLMILFAILFAMLLSSLLSTSQSFTPSISAKFSDKLSINYLFFPAPTRAQCIRLTSQFEVAIMNTCVACKINTLCQEGNHYETLLTALPSNTVIAKFPNGVASYATADQSTAQSLCESTAIYDVGIDCANSSDKESLVVNSIAKTLYGWLLLPALFGAIIATILFSIGREQRLPPDERAMTGHRQANAVITCLADVTGVTLSWLAVTHGLWITEAIPSSQLNNLTTFSLTLALCVWFTVGVRHYARRRALYDESWQIFSAVTLIGLVHIAITAFTGASGVWPVLLIWITALILVPCIRHLARIVLDNLDLWRRPVVVVGVGDNASSAIRAVTDDFTLGYKVLALADPDAATDPSASIEVGTGLPVISITQLEALEDKVEVLIALDSMQDRGAQQIVHKLVAANRRVHLIPSLRGLPTMGMQVSHFFSHNTVMLTMRNNLSRPDFKIVKRCFDLVAAAIGLILLSPLFLYVSVQVKKDGGPAFYGHTRIGKRGKPFNCLKFRSMHIDSQRMLEELLENDPEARAEWERDFKLKNDPRITKIGELIRATSIDELPQLFNVLRGEMSLVGPRPIIQEELTRYGDYQPFYLRVSPGITGLWQVSGRSDTSYDERVGLDVWYTQNWSLIYDIAILFKTVVVVLGRKGAY